MGDFAFQDCDKITDLTIPATTKLGYSNIFVNFPPLVERMEAILAGQFALNEASSLDSLTVPDGWESSRLGEDNAAGSGDTQVTKAARWTNENKTEAEVEFQFNYDKAQGMDFIFVVDYSGSMAEVGNLEADSDSRFTSMQSKLLDVADELLNTPGYDNRWPSLPLPPTTAICTPWISPRLTATQRALSWRMNHTVPPTTPLPWARPMI